MMTASLSARREHARAIFQAGLAAVDPGAAVRRAVTVHGAHLRLHDLRGPRHEIDLARFERVLLLGAGKAAGAMGAALEELLAQRLAGGLVIVPDGHEVPARRFQQRVAGHPVPDERGLAAAREVADIAGAADAGTLLLVVLSGGGSALMPLPRPGLDLAGKQALTRRLLAAGAPIDEVNSARRKLSVLKGGGLARLAAPATVVALVLSDVIGDRLDLIASGPTVCDPPLPHVTNLLVGSNRACLDACRHEAVRRGFAPALVLTDRLAGEARQAAATLLANAGPLRPEPGSAGLALIAGGETTVTVHGRGTGGRNQELVLGAVRALARTPGAVLLSAGTDGRDGPTDAAGAVADSETLDRATRLGLDPDDFLADNDSYTFFQHLDDLVITGPTLTNVMDVQLLLLPNPEPRTP